MPCYTVQTVELDPSKMDVPTLMAALKAEGLNPVHTYGRVEWQGGSYDMKTGVITSRSEERGNMVKRAYSNQVVKSQAARFGWSVKVKQDGGLTLMKGAF